MRRASEASDRRLAGSRRLAWAAAAIAVVAVLGGAVAAGDPGSAAPSVAPLTGAGPAAPPASCPVTIPTEPLVAPSPYPASPPARYDAAWYGTPELWTMLDLGGERWSALPREAEGYGQKTFWWSRAFTVMEEPRPAISVTGRRLDRAGPTFSAGPPGTNAAADFGSAMLVGVVVPTPGCWSITGHYRDRDLEYVVWVTDD
jgi:hypothetical protein